MKDSQTQTKKQYRVCGSAEVQPQSRSTDGRCSQQTRGASAVSFFSALAQKLALDGWRDLNCQIAETNLAANAQLLDKGVQVARISERIEKLEKKRRLNRLTAGKVSAVSPRAASRIASCSTVIERYEFSDGSDLYHSREYCGNRFCAICAERRSRRLVRKYAPIVAEFAKGKYGQHVVLTFANAGQLPDRALIGRMLRNLWRRKFWKQYGGVAGGLYSVESTYNETTAQFHCHVHVLLFTNLPVPCYRRDKNGRQFWMTETNQGLSAEWEKVTKGAAFIVRGQRWDGRITEMLKYFLKQSEIVKMDDEQLAQFFEWTAGARTISAFGGLYGLLPQVADDDESTDIDGAEILPGRRLVLKTVLEFDDRLGCYVPISSEECNEGRLNYCKS